MTIKNHINEALEILVALGFPKGQLNERSALTLLALLDLKSEESWDLAKSPLRGITPIMEFMEQQYGKKYAPNTRETVRRQTVHQFLDAGLIVVNPDWLTPDWPAPPGVRAVFTTRHGGVSVAPWDSMNLGDHVGDEPQHVAANRALLARSMAAAPVFLQQVHGTAVAVLDAPWSTRPVAVAVRAVTALSPTSTIRAAPASSRWVNRSLTGRAARAPARRRDRRRRSPPHPPGRWRGRSRGPSRPAGASRPR